MEKNRTKKELSISILYLILGILLLTGSVLEISGCAFYIERMIKYTYSMLIANIGIYKWIMLIMGIIITTINVLLIKENIKDLKNERKKSH